MESRHLALYISGCSKDVLSTDPLRKFGDPSSPQDLNAWLLCCRALHSTMEREIPLYGAILQPFAYL